MEYWDPKMETIKRSDLHELQLKRLKKTLRSAYNNVPFYNKKFNEMGIKPADIKTLDDVQKLPFTKKIRPA